MCITSFLSRWLFLSEMHRTCCFTYLYLQFVTSSRPMQDLQITVSTTPNVGHLPKFSAVFRTNVRQDS